MGKAYWTGKKRDAATKEKIRQNKLRYYETHIHASKGAKRSIESRIRMSLSHRGKTPWNKGLRGWQVAWNKGVRGAQVAWNKGIRATTEQKARLHQMNLEQMKRRGPTSIEQKLYDELARRGVEFEPQKLLCGKFTVDAFIPKANLAIEADGEYWHSLPKAKAHDKRENEYLPKNGYRLLRLVGAIIQDDTFRLILDEYV